MRQSLAESKAETLAESKAESLVESLVGSTMETEPREELVPKRGNRNSVVWFWFRLKKIDTDQKTVICKTCLQKVVSSDSNTSNLFYHLKTRHDEQHRDSVKMRETTSKTQTKKKTQQTSLTESFTKGIPYDKQSRRHCEITDAISTFICQDIYTVEKKGFVALVKTLDPRYNMPDRKHFSYVQLPRMYEECRAKVKDELWNFMHRRLICGRAESHSHI